jgi:hypothetical protein
VVKSRYSSLRISNCSEVSVSRFKSRMMFSPKVRNDGPWTLRIFTTRFVMGAVGESGSTAAEVEATIYCSFRTSCGDYQPTLSLHRRRVLRETHQDSYNGVVVWVTGIIRHSLDELKQVHDKVIVHLQQVFSSQVFDPGHLVHQLQQKPMQTSILVRTALDELEQSHETPFAYHGPKGVLVGPAVEEKKIGVDVELRKFVLLQQAVDKLRSHIAAVVAEYLALYEHLGTPGDVVFALEALVPRAGNQVEP